MIKVLLQRTGQFLDYQRTLPTSLNPKSLTSGEFVTPSTLCSTGAYEWTMALLGTQ